MLHSRKELFHLLGQQYPNIHSAMSLRSFEKIISELFYYRDPTSGDRIHCCCSLCQNTENAIGTLQEMGNNLGIPFFSNITTDDIVKGSFCEETHDRISPRCLNSKKKKKPCNFHKNIKADCEDCGTCNSCIGPRQYLEKMASEEGLDINSGLRFQNFFTSVSELNLKTSYFHQ